jgi:tRNA(Ile)-lysidine synthase
MNRREQTEKVKSFMQETIKIKRDTVVLMGVSGGSDSVALLCIMDELKDELGIELGVIHVEHGIRGPESVDDARFTENLCKKKNIPCRIISVDVPEYKEKTGTSEEEAARILRYQSFENEINRIEKSGRKCVLAVAHHKEDNAETILLQMLRGTGLKGLSGLDPVRDKIIRPLLELSKSEILDYLKKLNQEYRTDSTNSDREIQRNLVRLDVFPLLNKINSKATEHITECAESVREAEEYLSEEAEKWLHTNRDEDGSLNANKLAELKKVLGKQIILDWLRDTKSYGKDISRKQIEAIWNLSNGPDGKSVSLPGRMAVQKNNNRLEYIDDPGKNKTINNDKKIDIVIRKPEVGETVSFSAQGATYVVSAFYKNSESEIPQIKYTKWFDYDRIGTDLHFRSKMPGDYFVIDASGKSQLFRRYCINEKIPKEERDRILLFTESSLIHWAVGYRMGCNAEIIDETSRVLEIVRRETKK